MHNLWEEMLPFYIAGALPKGEATRLERHLERCEICSQSLNEWKQIATAVRAEAASQMRALPPLAPEILREASEQRPNQMFQTGEMPRLVPKPRSAPRYSAPIVTLVAAVTVLLIGGVLALMVMRPPDPNANGVALLPTSTLTHTPLPVTLAPSLVPTDVVPTDVPRIIVIEPSETPIRETATPLTAPTSLPPPTQLAFVPPPTQVVPLQQFPTYLPPPTATPFVEEAMAMSAANSSLASGTGGGGCAAQPAIPSGSVINLYARPRTDAAVLTTVAAADWLKALAVSDNGWYQVQSAAGSVGWVQQSLVTPSGSCDSLPLIPADTATDALATPTVLPFDKLEPTSAQTQTSDYVPPEVTVSVM